MTQLKGTVYRYLGMRVPLGRTRCEAMGVPILRGHCISASNSEPLLAIYWVRARTLGRGGGGEGGTFP
eukprot:jgi/Botrbrau1/12047/Bobra.0295s0003.1